MSAAPTDISARLDALTEETVASFAAAGTDRARELLSALARHLHALAREVELTEAEWEAAIAFLTRCGQISDDRRQEFILLSDVLGLSMTTVGLNGPTDPRATEATVFGPFFVDGAPEIAYGGDIAEGLPGTPCWVEGRVSDTAGTPIADAQLEVWEADDDGFYDIQRPGGPMAGRARTRTDGDGRYGFWSVLPAPYSIPADGPVGDLLELAGRSPMRPAHIHFMVSAPGCERLVTHIFVAGGPHLETDAVFGVKASLIYEFTEHTPGEAPAGRRVDVPWRSVSFDIALSRVVGRSAAADGCAGGR